jgi:glycosyltransferase involved in cell wall biosynthesis
MREALHRHLCDFDVLHIHAMFLWPGLAASRAAWEHQVPYVVSPRGMLVPELIARKSRMAKTAWIRLFDREMLRKAAAIHVTSQREAADLAFLGLKTQRIVRIPNGLDIPDFEDVATEARDDFVLYLGRLDPKKSVELLIEAMTQLPGVKLRIAGDGAPDYVRQLKALTERMGIEGRVTFLGHLDDKEKWQEYLRAAVFVLPSLSENFANAVLEAMAAGCPVVVTRGVGLAETIARERCGVLVERDPVAIATELRELIANRELREPLGRNGARVAREHFSWSQVADRMAEAYEDLIAATSPLRERLRPAR